MWRSTARIKFIGLRAAAFWGLAAAAWFPTGAGAVSPPNMPLPPCTIVNGVRTGACPAESEFVSGVAEGMLSVGGTATLRTVPTIPACSTWGKYTGVWTPSPCFAEVGVPVIVNCGFIDMRNGSNVFREWPCNEALYKNHRGVHSLFTLNRATPAFNNGTRCGDVPSFNTYVYGGPATQTETIWTSRAPSALECELNFIGARPDGLYGPTWVKVRTTIGYAVTGDNRPGGSPRSAEFYVPIDGDLRYGVDVDVTATASIQEADWDNGRVTAVYRGTVSNRGTETAENVQLIIRLPQQLKYVSTPDSNCAPLGAAGDPRSRGGTVECTGFDLPTGSHRSFDVVVRVVNATDLDGIQNGEIPGLPGVQYAAQAANDSDSSNNEAVARLDIPFRNGSHAETRIAMDVLAEHFDYMTDLRGTQCNVFRDEIFTRLEAIRASHPDVFANLSYGSVTSGEYDIAGGLYRSGGHVGVVVYVKGTNYRDTGFIINGTPMPSPISGDSMVGPRDGTGVSGSGFTSLDGRYLRTPTFAWPGTPKEEPMGGTGTAVAYGFEGHYGYNAHEFGGAPPANAAPEPGMLCPFVPEAVLLTTESPVELIITNSRGQRIETENGQLSTVQLESSFHSMAFPHEDGTFGWSLLLPPDNYNVQLRGTREGTYRFTRSTFAADGTPIDVIVDGTTTPGKVDEYTADGPVVTTPPPTTPPTTTPGDQSSGRRGGGGGFNLLMLLSMLGLLSVQRTRRR